MVNLIQKKQRKIRRFWKLSNELRILTWLQIMCMLCVIIMLLDRYRKNYAKSSLDRSNKSISWIGVL